MNINNCLSPCHHWSYNDCAHLIAACNTFKASDKVASYFETLRQTYEWAKMSHHPTVLDDSPFRFSHTPSCMERQYVILKQLDESEGFDKKMANLIDFFMEKLEVVTHQINDSNNEINEEQTEESMLTILSQLGHLQFEHQEEQQASHILSQLRVEEEVILNLAGLNSRSI